MRILEPVEGVDGDAVAAQAGAGPEGHEAEGLGGGRGDDLPDVDAHGLVDLLELVDQGDVHAAEGVLGDFGGLGGAAAADGHEGVDGLGIELGDGLEAGGGVAADDLGDGGDDAVGVAGVLALGAEGEVEVGAGLEAAALLEHGAELAVGGAGIGGGFEADEHALAQMRGDGAAGVGDVGDVGLTVLVEGRGHADDDGVHAVAHGEIVGGAEVTAFDLLGDAFGGDVLDVALAGVHGLDLAAVDVDARDVHPRTGELQAERQPHVTQTNDGDFVHVRNPFNNVVFSIAQTRGGVGGAQSQKSHQSRPPSVRSMRKSLWRMEKDQSGRSVWVVRLRKGKAARVTVPSA